MEWLDTQWLLPSGVTETAISFRMYPNPTSGILYIDAPSAVTEVSVYNLMGQLISVYPVVQDALHLNVEDGTYMVRFRVNEEVVSKMIVVKR